MRCGIESCNAEATESLLIHMNGLTLVAKVCNDCGGMIEKAEKFDYELT